MDPNDPNHPPAGWYQDPTGHGDARYWNGVAWTPSVTRGGTTTDIPVDESHVRIPPVPGSEYRSVAQPSPVAPAAPTVHVTQSSGRSAGGMVLAFLLGAVAIVAVIVALVVVSDGDDEPTEDTPTEEPGDGGTGEPQPENPEPEVPVDESGG